MDEGRSLACRLVACPERRDDGNHWSFYLVNDGDAPFDWAVLDEVVYDWGGMGSERKPDHRVGATPAGGHTLLWRDDDDAAELNIDLKLRIEAAGREWSLGFELPKLYKKRSLPPVDGVGKPGWEERPTRCVPVGKG